MLIVLNLLLFIMSALGTIIFLVKMASIISGNEANLGIWEKGYFLMFSLCYQINYWAVYFQFISWS